MHAKFSALTFVATLLAVGCNGSGQDGEGLEDDGIDLGDTEGDGEADGASDSDADGADADSDSQGSDGFPDTGDGSDSDGIVPTCGGERILLSSTRPSVMLLLDKSGSMVDNAWDHDANAQTEAVARWTSLHDVTSSLLGAYGDNVDFGAVLFPAADAQVLGNADYDSTFTAACRMQDDAEVAVGPETRDAILAAMPSRDAVFEGATPTREAVLNGLNHLESIDAAGPRAMVLVTDGAANCVYDPNTNIGRVYDTELEQTVRSAFEDNGIPTYVVGIDITAEHPVEGRNLQDDLNAVAEAGGVARDGEERFYNVADEDALATALDEIARRVECTVQLEAVPSDAETLQVELDGAVLPRLEACGSDDGWRYASDDLSTIELCNDACGDFREVQQLDTTHVCDPAG